MEKKEKQRRRSVRLLSQIQLPVENEVTENPLINQFEDLCGSVWKDCSPGYKIPRRRSATGRRSGIFKQLPVTLLDNGESIDRVDSPEVFRAPDDNSPNNSINARINISATSPISSSLVNGRYESNESHLSGVGGTEEMLHCQPEMLREKNSDFQKDKEIIISPDLTTRERIPTDFESPDYPEGIMISQFDINIGHSPDLSSKIAINATPIRNKMTPLLKLGIDDSLPYSPSQPVFSTPSLITLKSCSGTPISPEESLFDEDISMLDISEPKMSNCCLQDSKNQNLEPNTIESHKSARKQLMKKQPTATETLVETAQREKQETSSFFKICKSLASRLANAVRRTPDNSLNQSDSLESQDLTFVAKNQRKGQDSINSEDVGLKNDEVDGDSLDKLKSKVIESHSKLESERNYVEVTTVDVQHSAMENTRVECEGQDVNEEECTVDNTGKSNVSCLQEVDNKMTSPDHYNEKMNSDGCKGDIHVSAKKSPINVSLSNCSAVENESLEEAPLPFNDIAVNGIELSHECKKTDSGSKVIKSKRRSIDTQSLASQIDLVSQGSDRCCATEKSIKETKSRRRSADPVLLRRKQSILLETENVVKSGGNEFRMDNTKLDENKLNDDPPKKRSYKRKSVDPSLLSKTEKKSSQNADISEQVAEVSNTAGTTEGLAPTKKRNPPGRPKKSQMKNVRKLRSEPADGEIDQYKTSIGTNDLEIKINHAVRNITCTNESDGHVEEPSNVEDNTTYQTNSDILFNHRHCADFDKIQEFLSMDNDPILPAKRSKGTTKRRSTGAITSTENTSLSEDSLGESTDARLRRTTRVRRRSIEIYKAGTNDGCASESPMDSIDSMDENNSPGITDSSKRKTAGKRKVKEENIEDIYRNKNFKRPIDRNWETIFESPDVSKNPDQLLSKKRYKRTISFETTLPAKLKRRSKKAADVGWDSKKRRKCQLSDEFVNEKLAELDSLLKS